MLDTKNPVMAGPYNGISLGLYKFPWMFRTAGEIERFGKAKAIPMRLGHAKPLVILYAAIAALVPVVTAYLMTIEAIDPNGGGAGKRRG